MRNIYISQVSLKARFTSSEDKQKFFSALIRADIDRSLLLRINLMEFNIHYVRAGPAELLYYSKHHDALNESWVQFQSFHFIEQVSVKGTDTG